MLDQICGARPIHSLTGPAIAVTAETKRSDGKEDDQERRDPWRDAVALAGLDQRRQRQRDDRGQHDRQKNGAAEIEERPEQQEEDADGRGVAERGPHAADALNRLRVADDERMLRLAFGANIVHKTVLCPDPRVMHFNAKSRRAVPEWPPLVLSGESPLRGASGLLEGAS